MGHATIAKRKHSYQHRDDDSYLDNRTHSLSASAYHRAKQHRFLSGADVLKSLQTEVEIDGETTSAILRVVSA